MTCELEADVFEELDEQHQMEFIERRSDEQVAAVVARMAPDDAADLIAELEEKRRGVVLDLLPSLHQRKVRALLGYDPAEAGGLMSPDFVSVYRQATVGEVLERVRQSSLADELLSSDLRHGLTASLPRCGPAGDPGPLRPRSGPDRVGPPVHPQA